MNKSLDIFFETTCLTEQSSLLDGITLHKKWFKSSDKRLIGLYLQKFIAYNASLFEFLGVQVFITGIDQNIALSFKTSEFIGVIPLRAPDTGKQIGDFVVTPRFLNKNKFTDYIGILNLLEKDINPTTTYSIPLASSKNFSPPLYLEAIKFINLLEQLVRTPWRKFDTIEKNSTSPSAQINWTKYVNREFKIENRLLFPIKKNTLTEFHREYSQICHVFDLCKKEINSSNVPQNIKSMYKKKISFLDEKFSLHRPIFTNQILIKTQDNVIIRNCKIQANKILNYNLTDSVAWKVDFSDVYEKFIQYIFQEISKETGGKVLSNFKFHSKSKKHYSWELKHIEPDAIYQKNNTIIFIDAKYKSNLYNKFSTSEDLKNQYRFDLHQILAYSSFSKTEAKLGILCYPSNNVEMKETIFKNPMNNTSIKVFTLGIPLNIESLAIVKKTVKDILK